MGRNYERFSNHRNNKRPRHEYKYGLIEILIEILFL